MCSLFKMKLVLVNLLSKVEGLSIMLKFVDIKEDVVIELVKVDLNKIWDVFEVVKVLIVGKDVFVIYVVCEGDMIFLIVVKYEIM